MNELIVNKSEQDLTPEIIKKYICPQATEQEVVMFFQLCKSQGLNPFLREAYLIKYGDEKATMIVGKETFTKRADKLPNFDGFDAGIIVIDNEKKVVYRIGALLINGETLLGGWAQVYRKDRSHPIRAEVSLREYQRYNKKGELTKPWQEMPATMIRKVALVQALRESYPSEFGGVYTQEEMPTDSGTLPEYKIGQEIPSPIDMPKSKSQQQSPKGGDANPTGLYVQDVKIIKGKNKKTNKEWEKYEITDSQGVIYSTFSETSGEIAIEANKRKCQVELKSHEGKYGMELDEIIIVSQEDERRPDSNNWTKEKICDILSSADTLDVLSDLWNSLTPHIAKLEPPMRVECQKCHDKKYVELKDKGQ